MQENYSTRFQKGQKPRNASDLNSLVQVGQMFGLWEVISSEAYLKGNYRYVKVQCSGCGIEGDKHYDNLRAGKSGGCRICRDGRKVYYTKIAQKLSKIGNAAKDRCVNPNNPQYAIYGGRGITFDFKTIEEYVDHVLTLTKEEGQSTIDRINNNKGYQLGNLRWASVKEQMQNKRNNINVVYKDVEMCFEDFIKRYTDLSSHWGRTLYKRGFTPEQLAEYKPSNKGRRASKNFRPRKLWEEK